MNNIEIEVVYNGIVAKITGEQPSGYGGTIPRSKSETFIFKNMSDFMNWFKKNFGSPKKGNQFIDETLNRNEPRAFEYNPEEFLKSMPQTSWTTSNNTTGYVKTYNTGDTITIPHPKCKMKFNQKKNKSK